MLCAAVAGCAQSLYCDGDIAHFEGGVTGGLNNDGYEFDFSVAYFPVPYIGLKTSVGCAGEIEQIDDWGRDEWDTGHFYAARLKLNPAVVVRSPRIINWESQGAGFYLFTEPGFVLSPGARGSRHARWMRWNVRSGINLQIDRYVFTLGYGISNFSLYSGRPTSVNGTPDPDNYITHSCFIGCAFKF